MAGERRKKKWYQYNCWSYPRKEPSDIAFPLWEVSESSEFFFFVRRVYYQISASFPNEARASNSNDTRKIDVIYSVRRAKNKEKPEENRVSLGRKKDATYEKFRAEKSRTICTLNMRKFRV